MGDLSTAAPGSRASEALLGVDVGTTGIKAALVDEQGKVVVSASTSYPLLTPFSGWAEQDPETWWLATAPFERFLLRPVVLALMLRQLG